MTGDPTNAGFYVRNRNRVTGPHTLNDLVRQIRAGTLGRAQKISRDSINWQNAGDFAELFGGPLSLADVAAGAAQQAESYPQQAVPAGSATQADAHTKMYYRQNERTSGPMPVSQLVTLAESGQLSPDAVVWEEGAPSSRPAASHPLLQSVQWPDGADDESNNDRVFGGPVVVALAVVLLLLIGGGAGGIWWHYSSKSSDNSRSATPSAAPGSGSVQMAPAQESGSASVSTAAQMPTASAAAVTVPPSAKIVQAAIVSPPSPPIPVAPPVLTVAPIRANDQLPFITDVHNDAIVARAVGLVVVGANISAPGREPFAWPHSTGSCFAASAEGQLITNNHVVEEDADFRNQVQQQGLDFDPKVWVFFGRNKYVAQVLFASPKNDLAVLKIDAPARQPFFRLSGAARVHRGVDIFSLGFPGVAREPLSNEEFQKRQDAQGEHHANVEDYFNDRDFDYSLTRGVISRISRDSDGVTWIQHEAVVRHGNSGGPLVTDDGFVVGINTRIQTDQENDVQTNNGLELSQFRETLQRFIPTVVWDDSPPAGK